MTSKLRAILDAARSTLHQIATQTIEQTRGQVVAGALRQGRDVEAHRKDVEKRLRVFAWLAEKTRPSDVR